MPELLMGCVVDLSDVFKVLRKAALSMSMNINTDLKETDIGNPVLNAFLKVSAFLNSDLGKYNELGGNATALSIRVAQNNIMTDADTYHVMFCQNFLKFAEKGPEFAIRYLEEKWIQGEQAWRSVLEKFSNAKAVNNEVTTELNRARMRAHQVKTACDVALILGGAIAPVSWVSNTALGYSYSILCKLAANTSEAKDAKVFGWTAGNTLGHSVNAAQDIVDETVTNQKLQKFCNDAKAVSERANARLEQKMAQFRAQNGSNFSGAQKKILNSLSNQAINASEALDKAQAKLNPPQIKSFRPAPANQTLRTQTNLSAVTNAPTTAGKIAAGGVRAVGIGIGLFFAWDDITLAIEEISATPKDR